MKAVDHIWAEKAEARRAKGRVWADRLISRTFALPGDYAKFLSGRQQSVARFSPA